MTADAAAHTRPGPAALFTACAYLAFFIAVAIFVFYAFRGFWLSYSFWLDELYSVTVSAQGLAEAVAFSFREDVHPPLYQAILAIWLDLFGTSEAAARALSLVFSIATILALGTLRRLVPAPALFLGAALLAVHPFLVFYSQEVRSYALLGMLSMISLSLYLRGRYNWLYLSAMAMGLTHFFGALLAVFYIAYGAAALRARCGGSLVTPVMALIPILSWPVLQILFGNLGSDVGGGFWIEAGPVESVGLSLQALSPLLAAVVSGEFLTLSVGRPVSLLLAFALLGLVALPPLMFGNSAAGEGEVSYRMLILKTAAPASFLICAVAVISLHTPVATSRNFIAILPHGVAVAAISIAAATEQGRGWMIAAILLVAIASLTSIDWTREQLAFKFSPRENWKAAAEGAASAVEKTGLPVFYVGSSKRDEMRFRHYFVGDISKFDLEAEAMPSPPFVVLFGHETCTGPGRNRITDSFDEAGLDYELVLPLQARRCNSGYAIVQRPSQRSGGSD